MSKDDQSSQRSSAAWRFVAALLLLRICIGWHFFSEGTKKLTYDEGRQTWGLAPEFVTKAENLFRSATGPLASFYKNQLPGFYDWENLLAVPQQSSPLTENEIRARQQWLKDYNDRRKKAERENEPLPIEFPEHAAYRAWAEEIVAGLSSKLAEFTDLPEIDETQAAEAAEFFVGRKQQLADFLNEESDAIVEYQHELWRLENLAFENGATEIPFRQERVGAKRKETNSLGARLVSEVSGIERGFVDDLRSVLTAEQKTDAEFSSRIDRVLTNVKERRLRIMHLGVTCLIIGVGVCLMLGLFTRAAAAGGMLFLLSVMVTQLPWVRDANPMYFYYQLVEFVALLTLLVSGPWRLPGLDGMLRGFWCKCCGSKS